MARSKPVARAAVLLAFVVLVASCLGAAAAKGTGCDGQCGGCKKKKCKFDDRCFYDPAANFCQDVGPNVCRGIQKRHGGKAFSFANSQLADVELARPLCLGAHPLCLHADILRVQPQARLASDVARFRS